VYVVAVYRFDRRIRAANTEMTYKKHYEATGGPHGSRNDEYPNNYVTYHTLSGMQRRKVLTGGITVAVGIGVAGCSGGGDSADEDEDEENESNGGDETTAGPGSSNEDGSSGGGTSASGLLSSEVDELELTDSRYTDTGIEGRFPVTVTVANNGDQETDITAYSYDYTVSDDSGNDLTSGTSSTAESPTVAPGETAEILLTAIVDGDPDDVASYTVRLSCGSFGEGAYCEE